MLLDGNKIAAEIKAELAVEVKQLREQGLQPGLAVILAGNNAASEVYVRGKVKTCEQIGVFSEKLASPPGYFYRTTAGADSRSESPRLHLPIWRQQPSPPMRWMQACERPGSGEKIRWC